MHSSRTVNRARRALTLWTLRWPACLILLTARVRSYEITPVSELRSEQAQGEKAYGPIVNLGSQRQSHHPQLHVLCDDCDD